MTDDSTNSFSFIYDAANLVAMRYNLIVSWLYIPQPSSYAIYKINLDGAKRIIVVSLYKRPLQGIVKGGMGACTLFVSDQVL